MKKQKKNRPGVDLKGPDFWKYLGVRLDEIAGHRLRVTDENHRPEYGFFGVRCSGGYL